MTLKWNQLCDRYWAATCKHGFHDTVPLKRLSQYNDEAWQLFNCLLVGLESEYQKVVLCAQLVLNTDDSE